MASGGTRSTAALFGALFLLAGPVACESGGPADPEGQPADDDETPSGDDDSLPGDDDDDDDDASGDDDSGVVSLEAELVPSEVIPTVATLVWPVVEGATDAYAEFAREGEPLRAAPAREEDGMYRAVILGMKPDTVYRVRAAVMRDGQLHTSPEATFQTGFTPSSLPGNLTTSRDPERATDGFFVTMLASDGRVAVILDQDYEFVWWYPVDTGESVAMRAHLSRDRQSVLIQGNEVMWRVSVDGETAEELPIPSHHDFLEMPDGTIATLEYEEREIDGETVLGDRLVEYPPSGDSRVVWTSFDSFDYDPNAPHDFPDVDMGWSHANVVRYDAERDRFAVSVRNYHTIVMLDRESGDELYRIGGDDSDVATSTGETELFFGQHGFELLPDGILVYDNGSAERMSTMVVEYGIDLDSGMAELRYVHQPNPPLYNLVGGDVTRLASSNTLVTWSYLGLVEEVALDGAVVGKLQLPIGHGLGYLSWVEDLYAAPSGPAAVESGAAASTP